MQVAIDQDVEAGIAGDVEQQIAIERDALGVRVDVQPHSHGLTGIRDEFGSERPVHELWQEPPGAYRSVALLPAHRPSPGVGSGIGSEIMHHGSRA
jgi:hypothetical protein